MSATDSGPMKKDVGIKNCIALDFGESPLTLSDLTIQGVSEYDETTSSFTELCNRVDVWNEIVEWISKSKHVLHVRTLC